MVDSSDRVPIEPQSIIAPLSRAAVFLVVSIGSTPEAVQQVRRVIADIGGLVRTVGFRDLQGRLSCNVAIGSAAWDRLGQSRQLDKWRSLETATQESIIGRTKAKMLLEVSRTNN